MPVTDRHNDQIDFSPGLSALACQRNSARGSTLARSRNRAPVCKFVSSLSLSCLFSLSRLSARRKRLGRDERGGVALWAFLGAPRIASSRSMGLIVPFRGALDSCHTDRAPSLSVRARGPAAGPFRSATTRLGVPSFVGRGRRMVSAASTRVPDLQPSLGPYFF